MSFSVIMESSRKENLKKQKHVKIFKVYTTVKEMLFDRGYTEFVTGKISHSLDELVDMHIRCSLSETMTDIPETFDKQSLNFTCLNPLNGKLILVNFTNDDSIGRKHVISIHETMVASKLQHCILIYPKTLTSSAKKDLEKSKIYIESFAENELIVNITKHYLTPKYKVLSEMEKNELYNEKSQIKDSQLPRILVNDKSARYYGMRRGDVIQIVRKSETCGLAVSYRICN